MSESLSLLFNLSVLVFVLASMFGLGLSLTLKQVLEPMRNVSLVLKALAANFILAPLLIAVGDKPDAHPSVTFLFHAWAMPALLDVLIMSGLWLVWAGGMYCLARAYSLALASVVAPFEYVALPINIMWGFVLWHEIPTGATLVGAALTLLSGLYVLFREQTQQPVLVKT